MIVIKIDSLTGRVGRQPQVCDLAFLTIFHKHKDVCTLRCPKVSRSERTSGAIASTHSVCIQLTTSH